MGFLHTIRALLYKNPLSDAPNDYVARVKADRTLTLQDICQSAAQRGGAAMNARTLETAALDVLQEAVYRLGDGFSVNLEWFTASVHIRGVFDSAQAHFDPAKHQALVEVHPNVKLTAYIRDNVDIVVEGEAEVGPHISRVVDAASGTTDNLITSDRNVFIYGQKIKIAGSHPSVGVAFINAADGAEYSVPAANIVINEPSRLQILVPHYPANTALRLRITTQYSSSSGRPLNEPRWALFDKTLTTALPA
jgi:hypothetical protein